MDVYLKYEDEFLDINDNKLALPDPDPNANRLALKDAQDAIDEARKVAKEEGKPIVAPRPFQPSLIEDVTCAQVMFYIADGIPYGEPPTKSCPECKKTIETGPALRATNEDRLSAAQVIRAFKKASKEKLDHVILPQEPLSWMVKLVEEHGDTLFNSATVSVMVLDRLEKMSAEDEVELTRRLGLTEDLKQPQHEASMPSAANGEDGSAASASAQVEAVEADSSAVRHPSE